MEVGKGEVCEGDGRNEVDNDDDDSTLFSLGRDAAGKHNLSLSPSASVALSSMLLCAVSLFG